ncbi:major facilitator superfamily domain-containing protein [Aspergillus aurantiobrunneus]
MMHWRVLAAVGAMNWGAYFVYDIPASLSTSLSEHLSLPEPQFAYLVSLLYVVYAVPNTVLPFFSGAAVQRFGERTILLGIISCIITGQLLFATAVHTKLQLGMIAGRALIGLGGEVVGVLGCEIITRWFQDRRLSLALAINLGLGRLGSVANTLVIPRLVGPYGVVSATWIATVLALSVATIGLVSFLSIAEPADESLPANEDASFKSVSVDPFPFRQFPPVFWQLALLCLMSFGCLNTFTNSAQRFLAMRFYRGDQRAAGEAMSILFILSGLLVPPFGFLLDKLSSTGYPRALVTGNVFLIFAHTILLSGALASPILPLCLLGSADALLNVSFWASVVRCLLQSETNSKTPLLKTEDRDKSAYDSILTGGEAVPDYLQSDEEELDTGDVVRGEAVRTLGLGIMASLMNISTAVVPVALAVMENLAGASGLEVVFLLLAVCGCLAAVRLAWM